MMGSPRQAPEAMPQLSRLSLLDSLQKASLAKGRCRPASPVLVTQDLSGLSKL